METRALTMKPSMTPKIRRDDAVLKRLDAMRMTADAPRAPVKAAEAIEAAGAVCISLYITHCEDAISKGDIFKKDIFENVFTTNSLIRSEETNSKLTIIH